MILEIILCQAVCYMYTPPGMTTTVDSCKVPPVFKQDVAPKLPTILRTLPEDQMIMPSVPLAPAPKRDTTGQPVPKLN